MKTAIDSSLKLRFQNIVRMDPGYTLRLIDEEFVSTDEYSDYPYWNNSIGEVSFGKVKGKIFDMTDAYVIVLSDGRTYSFSILNED